MLNLRELLDVASLLQCARLMQGYFAEQEGKTSLTPIYRLLTGNRTMEEHITSCIVSEEEIADGASRNCPPSAARSGRFRVRSARRLGA